MLYKLVTSSPFREISTLVTCVTQLLPAVQYNLHGRVLSSPYITYYNLHYQCSPTLVSQLGTVAKCRCPSSIHRDGHPVLTNTQLWVSSLTIHEQI